MTTVYYSTPYRQGDIGGGINDFISLLPDDAWVCIRDADTMFLTPSAQMQIGEIANSKPAYDVIGCMTNRLRSPAQTFMRDDMFDCADIGRHQKVAEMLERQRWCELSPMPHGEAIAGMFMLFRVSLWRLIKFQKKSVYFDKRFCEAVVSNGGRLGLANGIYLFHMYRWGHPDPFNYTEHLK